MSSTGVASPGAATVNGSTMGESTYQMATDSEATNITAATAAISQALKFATSKSIRTSTIILASFNAFAALITAVGIIHGCRAYNRRMQRRASDSPPSGLFYIHTVEVFPLVLSLGITVQSLIFAAAQSIGLEALLSRNCSTAAVFMLPAVFIVPYIHLVFGVETALRGLRSNFAPRGKWNVRVCLGLIGFFTLATFIVAAVDRAPNYCFASLFWFVKHYAVGCFAVLLMLSTTTLAAIAAMSCKLKKSQTISSTERLTATRMIFYLALGFISEVLVLPFFFSLTFWDPKKHMWNTLSYAMVAAVVSNVNGLMVAGLHLFLRTRNSYAHQDFGDYERKEDLFRPYDPHHHRGSDLSLQAVDRSASRARSGSRVELLHADDGASGQGFSSPMSYGTARSPFSAKISIPSNPAFPEPTQPPSETSPSQIRKQSYSLYPDNSPAAAAVLPSMDYSSSMATKPSLGTYNPPPIVKPWVRRGHRRNSSVGSTATVQIGIRFSNVEDFVPRKSSDTDVLSRVADVPDAQTMPVFRPSPLADVQPRTTSSYSQYSATVPALTLASSDASATRSPPRSRRMKTLPPVPRSPAISIVTDYEPDAPSEEVSPVSDAGDGAQVPEEFPEVQLITLSPTVYREPVDMRRTASNRSARKPHSPNGVGSSSPKSSDARFAAMPPPRPAGSAATTPLPRTKAAWI